MNKRSQLVKQTPLVIFSWTGQYLLYVYTFIHKFHVFYTIKAHWVYSIVIIQMPVPAGHDFQWVDLAFCIMRPRW